jgi:betaine-aldehyde dehydrogenase
VKIGDSLGAELVSYEGASMGPVVSRGQFDKIWAFIDEAKAAGVPLLYGGERSMVQDLGKGYFIPPTIFVDVPTSARVWQEEIFGPVLCIRVSLSLGEDDLTIC